MVMKFSELKEKESPLRVGAQRGRVGRPDGDKRGGDNEIRTEDSNATME